MGVVSIPRRTIAIAIIMIGIILIAATLNFAVWMRSQQNDFQTKIEQRTNVLNELKTEWVLEVNKLNDTYKSDLNLSQTPSISRGLIGLTVVPRGGGPGDRLSEEPLIPPINFTRNGGTNFAYGPLQKTTRIDILNASLIWVHSILPTLPFRFVGGTIAQSKYSDFN